MSATQSADDSVTANRRRQLRRWLDVMFDGNQSAFGASTADGEHQINQGELSGLLRKKSFGEKRARRLERQARMPAGYLDSTSEPNDTKLTPFTVAEPVGNTKVSPAPHIIWPFKLASFVRLSEMRAALGPQRGAEAIHDIDKHLDIVITKWERETVGAKKRVARR
ncbi:MAG: hypothetical protein EOP50_09560 [Sphingobacteriales bacterium]|nr:MAG: hypothetical protein EOP50_09560 [Sphingobacteriales bacterium]